MPRVSSAATQSRTVASINAASLYTGITTERSGPFMKTRDATIPADGDSHRGVRAAARRDSDRAFHRRRFSARGAMVRRAGADVVRAVLDDRPQSRAVRLSRGGRAAVAAARIR